MPGSNATIAKPAAPVLNDVVAGDAQNTLSWSIPASQKPINAYRIYRKTSAGVTTANFLEDVSASAAPPFVNADLTNAQAYYYKVAAISSAGLGALSNEEAGTPVAAAAYTATAGRPFQQDGPFNLPIPANPVIDQYSAGPNGIIALLTAPAFDGHKIAVANISAFGCPVWAANSSTPKYTVALSSGYYSPHPFSGKLIPIPDGAHPSGGDPTYYDGAMVVVDFDTMKSYEFYEAVYTPGASNPWKAKWGDIQDCSPSGEGNNGLVIGSGISRLACVVQDWEFEALRNGSKDIIDHAMCFTSQYTYGPIGNNDQRWKRYPATHSDGKHGMIDNRIVEGSRVWLDATDGEIAAIVDPIGTSGQTTLCLKGIARTLRRYGAYCVDANNTTAMTFIFDSSNPDPYADAGWGDYHPLARLQTGQGTTTFPWSKLKVLRSWDGT